MVDDENLDIFKSDVFFDNDLSENLFREKSPFTFSDHEISNYEIGKKINLSNLNEINMKERVYFSNNISNNKIGLNKISVIKETFEKEHVSNNCKNNHIEISMNNKNTITNTKSLSKKEKNKSDFQRILANNSSFIKDDFSTQSFIIQQINFEKNISHDGLFKKFLIENTNLIDNQDNLELVKNQKINKIINIKNERNNLKKENKLKYEVKRNNAKLLSNKLKRNNELEFSENYKNNPYNIFEKIRNDEIISNSEQILNKNFDLNDDINILDKENKILNLKEYFYKIEKRKIKNRESALKSRLSKKLKYENLTELNKELRGQNDNFKIFIYKIEDRFKKLCQNCKENINFDCIFNENMMKSRSSNLIDNSKDKVKINDNICNLIQKGKKHLLKNKIPVKINDIKNQSNENFVVNSNNNKKLSIVTGILFIVCIISALLNSFNTKYSIENKFEKKEDTLILRNLNLNYKNIYDDYNSTKNKIKNPIIEDKYTLQKIIDSNLIEFNNSYSKYDLYIDGLKLNKSNRFNNIENNSYKSINKENIPNRYPNLNNETRFLMENNEDLNINIENNAFSPKPNFIFELIEKDSMNNETTIKKDRITLNSNNKINIDNNQNFYNLVFTSLKCNNLSEFKYFCIKIHYYNILINLNFILKIF